MYIFLQVRQLVDEGFFESFENFGPYQRETAHAIFKLFNWQLNSTESPPWPKLVLVNTFFHFNFFDNNHLKQLYNVNDNKKVIVVLIFSFLNV